MTAHSARSASHSAGATRRASGCVPRAIPTAAPASLAGSEEAGAGGGFAEEGLGGGATERAGRAITFVSPLGRLARERERERGPIVGEREARQGRRRWLLSLWPAGGRELRSFSRCTDGGGGGR